nr:TetR/AcrR family transcriptional regulator C-terminal domain-containing protein [Nocardiopsis mwathae]
MLWRDTATARPEGRSPRGRKPKLTVAGIAAAAIAVADREGVEAMAMSRVAAELGVATMSLYTYVPGKAELIDLMVDTVMRERALPGPDDPDLPAHWRARIELYAARTLAVHRRHPWFGRVSTVRPPLGPGLMAEQEYLLSALSGIGLSARRMNAAASAIATFVEADARARVESENAEALTGQSEDAWWAAREHVWEEHFDMERFPTLTQVYIDMESGEPPEGLDEENFGLHRMLDGIQAMIDAQG